MIRIAVLLAAVLCSTSTARAQETWERFELAQFGFEVETPNAYGVLGHPPGDGGQTRDFGFDGDSDVALTLQAYGLDDYAADLAGWLVEARTASKRTAGRSPLPSRHGGNSPTRPARRTAGSTCGSWSYARAKMTSPS